MFSTSSAACWQSPADSHLAYRGKERNKQRGGKEREKKKAREGHVTQSQSQSQSPLVSGFLFFFLFSFSVFVHFVFVVFLYVIVIIIVGVCLEFLPRLGFVSRRLLVCSLRACAQSSRTGVFTREGGRENKRCWSSLTLSLLTARCEYQTQDSLSPEGPPRGVTRRCLAVGRLPFPSLIGALDGNVRGCGSQVGASH